MKRREFSSLSWKAGVCGVLAPFECPSKTKKNNNPITNSVDVNFKDDGKVEYVFSGNDEDGFIDYIDIVVNEKSLQVYNGYNYSSLIIEGINSVSAIAYDNKGKPGNTAIYSFVSPTNEDAVKKIEDILVEKNAKYGSFEKNVLVSYGEWRSFYVDFLIKKKNNTDAIIHYISHKNSLANELLNKKAFEDFGISNLYLARFPLNEIQSRVNNFMNTAM